MISKGANFRLPFSASDMLPEGPSPLASSGRCCVSVFPCFILYGTVHVMVSDSAFFGHRQSGIVFNEDRRSVEALRPGTSSTHSGPRSQSVANPTT